MGLLKSNIYGLGSMQQIEIVQFFDEYFVPSQIYWVKMLCLEFAF